MTPRWLAALAALCALAIAVGSLGSGEGLRVFLAFGIAGGVAAICVAAAPQNWPWLPGALAVLFGLCGAFAITQLDANWSGWVITGASIAGVLICRSLRLRILSPA